MVKFEDLKNVKTKEEAERKVEDLIYGERGGNYLRNNDRKKRISKKRITLIIGEFVALSICKVTKYNNMNQGGYLDYYLINADKFTDDEVIDYAMFFKTLDYLKEMILNKDLEKRKFLSVEDLLFFSHAGSIFEYKFRTKKFQEWQDRLFKIITLQNLPK